MKLWILSAVAVLLTGCLGNANVSPQPVEDAGPVPVQDAGPEDAGFSETVPNQCNWPSQQFCTDECTGWFQDNHEGNFEYGQPQDYTACYNDCETCKNQGCDAQNVFDGGIYVGCK